MRLVNRLTGNAYSEEGLSALFVIRSTAPSTQMSYWSRHRDFLALPEDLIAFAWSAPMRDLAQKFGTSDVALRKLLKKYGVVTPPQGHWNRVHAGRTVPGPPKPQPRRPGETGRLCIDHRFEQFVAKANPMPSSGPFASKEVPEDLDDLRARETKLLGKVSVPKTLETHHPALADILRKEQRRREKVAEYRWYGEGPQFDNPVDLRQLRLLNGLFLALAKRGHTASVYVNDRPRQFRPSACIGDTSLSLEIGILGKHATVWRAGERIADPNLPASTPLFLRCSGADGCSWQDEAGSRLESRIGEIAVALIVAGEAAFRRRLKEAEIRDEEERIERLCRQVEARWERERKRLEHIRKQNEQRIADLRMSGELLRQSQDLRALVVAVRLAMQQRADVTTQSLAAWEEWALGEADKLDPIMSGQIMSHLYPPVPPAEEVQ